MGQEKEEWPLEGCVACVQSEAIKRMARGACGAYALSEEEGTLRTGGSSHIQRKDEERRVTKGRKAAGAVAVACIRRRDMTTKEDKNGWCKEDHWSRGPEIETRRAKPKCKINLS